MAKKIWVNDGSKVTEYAAVEQKPDGSMPAQVDETPSPVPIDVVKANLAAYQQTSAAANVQEQLIDDTLELATAGSANEQGAKDGDTYDVEVVNPEDTAQEALRDGHSAAKTRFRDSVQEALRATPGATLAYGKDAASGTGKAARWASALAARQYSAAKPVLKGVYAAAAKQLDAAQSGPQPQRRAPRRSKTTGMRSSPGSRTPKIKVVNKR